MPTTTFDPRFSDPAAEPLPWEETFALLCEDGVTPAARRVSGLPAGHRSSAPTSGVASQYASTS